MEWRRVHLVDDPGRPGTRDPTGRGAHRGWWGIVLLLAVCRLVGRADERDFLIGQSRIQRFHALCRGTVPAPPIRVLIYGQSITEQRWSGAAVLRAADRFPGRDWVIENRCIGGVTAEFLVRTAEADLYPFNPDLVIFHAYGETNAYARLVHAVRTRTTAEMILMNDHYAQWDDRVFPNLGQWNGEALPALATTEGVCVADVRRRWREVLLRQGLPISALLQDAVHPNEAGQEILGDLLFTHLTGPTAWPRVDPFDDGRVRRLTRPPSDAPGLEWRVAFTGNRIAARIPRGARATVQIDGLPPGGSVSGRVHGRAPTWPGTPWPCIVRIGREVPLLDEVWTLRVGNVVTPDAFEFSLCGSLTGEDGSGSTWEPFRSNSGRVVLMSEDWYWDRIVRPVTAGMEFEWRTIATGTDAVEGVGPADHWIDLASNLPVGSHELVLTSEVGTPLITELIVYDPSGSPRAPPGSIRLLFGKTGVLADSALPVEASSDLRTWARPESEGTLTTPTWVPSGPSRTQFFRTVAAPAP